MKRGLVLAVLLGLVASCGVSWSADGSAEPPLVRRYKKQRDAEEYQAALQTILGAHHGDLGNPDVLALVGEAYMNVGDWWNAVVYLREAMAEGAGGQEVKTNLTRALVEAGWKRYLEGYPEVAQSLWKEAIEVGPDHAPAYTAIGICLVDEGRLEAALGYFRQAAELEPENPDALFNVAQTLGELGQLAAAAETLRKAAKLKPEDVSILNDLAWNMFQLGQSAEALEHAREALRGAPEDPAILHTLAAIQLDLGESEEALRNAEQALGLEPKEAKDSLALLAATVAACHASLGHKAEAEAKLAQAEEALERMEEDTWNRAWAAYYMGKTAELLGMREEALTWYGRVLTLIPEFPRADLLRAYLGPQAEYCPE